MTSYQTVSFCMAFVFLIVDFFIDHNFAGYLISLVYCPFTPAVRLFKILLAEGTRIHHPIPLPPSFGGVFKSGQDGTNNDLLHLNSSGSFILGQVMQKYILYHMRTSRVQVIKKSAPLLFAA